MRHLFIVTFVFITTFALFAQQEYIPVGEVIYVDHSTGLVEIKIYHKMVASEVTTNTELILLDENNRKIAIFTPDNIYYAQIPLKLTAALAHGQYSVYTGQKIGIALEKKAEVILPDQRHIPPTPEKYYRNTIDASQMVLIPNGPFVFGSDIPGTVHYTTPVEKVRTTVQKVRGQKRVRYYSLKHYYIDIYEITREQFKRFMLETGSAPPPGWDDQMEQSLPVHNLSYIQAHTYCTWAGKRLPTELEWEKAARGSGLEVYYKPDDSKEYIEQILIYPTGLSFNPEVCVTSETLGRIQSIYTLKDKNVHGIFGLCGNAAEWTSSWYTPYRGNSIRDPDFGKKYKVIRGGAFNLPSKFTKTYERLPGGNPSLVGDFRAGARCVKDIK
ncbi:MAG: SUMF1/EgtB/PvdO family nonheme iron enzyme [Leptospirales bacterium]